METTTYQFGDIIVDISNMTVKKDGETLFVTLRQQKKGQLGRYIRKPLQNS